MHGQLLDAERLCSRARRVAAIGIHGNGHMMMIEKNNQQVAEVMTDWLDRAGALTGGGGRALPCTRGRPRPS